MADHYASAVARCEREERKLDDEERKRKAQQHQPKGPPRVTVGSYKARS